MNAQQQSTTPQTERQRWISVLATANVDQLTQYWQQLALSPDYQVIRPAEIGLAQVQARMGGTGNRFNVGDVTVTRCVVKLSSGCLGHSYLSGRDKGHAELAAVIDGLMQSDDYQQRLMQHIIVPLETHRDKQHQQRQQQISTSKVDFFTLVRGED